MHKITGATAHAETTGPFRRDSRHEWDSSAKTPGHEHITADQFRPEPFPPGIPSKKGVVERTNPSAYLTLEGTGMPGMPGLGIGGGGFLASGSKLRFFGIRSRSDLMNSSHFSLWPV